jgi:hypothetical protein
MQIGNTNSRKRGKFTSLPVGKIIGWASGGQEIAAGKSLAHQNLNEDFFQDGWNGIACIQSQNLPAGNPPRTGAASHFQPDGAFQRISGDARAVGRSAESV